MGPFFLPARGALSPFPGPPGQLSPALRYRSPGRPSSSGPLRSSSPGSHARARGPPRRESGRRPPARGPCAVARGIERRAPWSTRDRLLVVVDAGRCMSSGLAIAGRCMSSGARDPRAGARRPGPVPALCMSFFGARRCSVRGPWRSGRVAFSRVESSAYRGPGSKKRAACSPAGAKARFHTLD
jgi:hypothetical protein